MTVEQARYMVMVADAGRAASFYRDALGFEVRFVADDGTWSELVWHERILNLHGGGTGARADTGLGFDVDDLDATCAAVEAAGGRVTRPPAPYADIAIATDTEGNRFALAGRGACIMHPAVFPASG